MDDLNLLEDSGDSDEFGTTNVVLILGNYIFIATDSRLTSMDMVTISKLRSLFDLVFGFLINT